MTDFVSHLRESATHHNAELARSLALARKVSANTRQRLISVHLTLVRKRLETQAFLLSGDGVTYGSWEFMGEDLTDDLLTAIKQDKEMQGIAVRRQHVDGVAELNLSFSSAPLE